MTINSTWFIDRLKQVFTPAPKENNCTEPDKTINTLATERIRRSPGHQNLSDLSEEPDWYRE